MKLSECWNLFWRNLKYTSLICSGVSSVWFHIIQLSGIRLTISLKRSSLKVLCANLFASSSMVACGSRIWSLIYGKGLKECFSKSFQEWWKYKDAPLSIIHNSWCHQKQITIIKSAIYIGRKSIEPNKLRCKHRIYIHLRVKCQCPWEKMKTKWFLMNNTTRSTGSKMKIWDFLKECRWWTWRLDNIFKQSVKIAVQR